MDSSGNQLVSGKGGGLQHSRPNDCRWVGGRGGHPHLADFANGANGRQVGPTMCVRALDGSGYDQRKRDGDSHRRTHAPLRSAQTDQLGHGFVYLPLLTVHTGLAGPAPTPTLGRVGRMIKLREAG